MGKAKPTVEWSVIEDEELWTASQTTLNAEENTRTEMAVRAVNRTEKHLAIGAIVLFLFLLGGWLWEKQHLATKTTNELQAAVVQELLVAPTQSESSSKARSSTPPGTIAPPLVPSVQVDEVHRLNNRVMTQMTVSYPEEGIIHPYRETRFYQKAGDGWQRIDPDPDLMGPLQTLKTAHFTIHYRAVDAEAIYETAPRVEQLYAKLRGDFGLPVAEATSTYTIEVVANNNWNWYHFSVPKRMITIPSPVVLSVPVEMTATTVLYHSLVYSLARLIVFEFLEQDQVQWEQYQVQRVFGIMRWYPMSNGLSLWILWKEGGPLVEGREEIVRWLYEREWVEGARIRQPLPDGYVQLCRTYRIWHLSPIDHDIPLACSELDMQALTPQDYLNQPNWADERSIMVEGTLEHGFSSTVSTETILEYIVATYGKEQLPLMLAALGQHRSAETLIPAVFGVSSAEFEAGWLKYLAKQYGEE